MKPSMKSRLRHAPFVAAFVAASCIAAPASGADGLTEPKVRALLTEKGYTRIDDLEFEDGMWETDATSADGNRVDLRVDANGKIYAEDVVSNFTAEDIKAKVTAAGYSKVHDVDYDDGVWKAEAERDDGNNIEVRVDASSGRILAVEND